MDNDLQRRLIESHANLLDWMLERTGPRDGTVALLTEAHEIREALCQPDAGEEEARDLIDTYKATVRGDAFNPEGA